MDSLFGVTGALSKKDFKEAIMYGKIREALEKELKEISSSGLYKTERHISSAQEAMISVGEKKVLNMCANNYLGLANNPEIIAAVKEGLDTRGFGMASVRFICGTQDIHQELENKISDFFGTDDTILYSSCFDANGGLFETLLGEKDAVISDALNHASIIDGVRLCKAARYRYNHGEMKSLENCLKEAASAQNRMIATDGVFSMDGDFAKLDQICDLAETYNALVMVGKHTMPLSWWMIATLPVSLVPQDAARPNCAAFKIELMLLPLPWARPLGVGPEGLPPVVNTLSICSGSVPGLTCFQIPCRLPSFRQRL
jgi:hypothetical protein